MQRQRQCFKYTQRVFAPLCTDLVHHRAVIGLVLLRVVRVQRVRHVGRHEEGAARGRVDVHAAVDARERLISTQRWDKEE